MPRLACISLRRGCIRPAASALLRLSILWGVVRGRTVLRRACVTHGVLTGYVSGAAAHLPPWASFLLAGGLLSLQEEAV